MGTTKKGAGKHSDVFFVKKKVKSDKEKGRPTDVRATCGYVQKKCRDFICFFIKRERERKKVKHKSRDKARRVCIRGEGGGGYIDNFFVHAVCSR